MSEDEVIIWHNPRCSKSRATLRLLEERGIAPKIRLYLKDPPSVDELRDVARKLGVGPRQMMRVNEPEYRAQGLAEADDEALFAAMAATPKLIERPIVIHGERAAIGRPPEAV
ncbi:MAG: arsenate reductase (glutaredoxin), partial [Alphaproteobacteria bacterium]